MRPLALATLFLLPASLAAQSPLCNQIQTLIAGSPAQWGISLTTLDGTPLCAVNAAKLFRPASNAKLFTTAAALALLGPDKTFETRVTGTLDPATGIVQGDLTLVGGGDANLDSGNLAYSRASESHPPLAFHDLENLAAQLAAKGVKSITGNIVGDDTLFPHEPYPFAWELDDLTAGFAAPVSALTLADNQLDLTITPIKGQRANVVIDQHGLPYYTVQAELNTIPADSPITPGIQIERLPGSRTLRIYGNIRDTTKPVTTQIAIDDPAAFAAMAFRSILLAHGITVAQGSHAKHQPPHDGMGFIAALHAPGGSEALTVSGGMAGGSCVTTSSDPALALHRSAPLAEDVAFTLKTSQNLHAELLLHALGRVVFCGQGSTAAGARLVRAFLLQAGLAPDDFLFFDGSGLSDRDLITPRSVTQLLAYAAKQPWFPTFKAALPIAGVDGTLANRFTDSNLKGKILAKTGTLGETRTLSGFLTAASGQTLIFSILVDNHPYASTADRTLTDHLLDLIAAAN